jgi:hypothetical protein
MAPLFSCKKGRSSFALAATMPIKSAINTPRATSILTGHLLFQRTQPRPEGRDNLPGASIELVTTDED